MNIKVLLLSFILIIFAKTENIAAFSFSTANPYVIEEISVNQGIKPAAKKKAAKKIRKKTDGKAFPLYGTLAVSAGILGLLMLGLGIYLSFPVYMGIFAGLFALTALVMGIMGLKKGESKSLCFIGIMLGAVGILGAIFYAVSIAS